MPCASASPPPRSAQPGLGSTRTPSERSQIALLDRRELDVGAREPPGVLVLGPVEAGASQPVRPGQLKRVMDPRSSLLGRVHEEQPAERPERLPAERCLGLLLEQKHTLTGSGELGRGDQARQPAADDDRVGVQLRVVHARDVKPSRAYSPLGWRIRLNVFR